MIISNAINFSLLFSVVGELQTFIYLVDLGGSGRKNDYFPGEEGKCKLP